MDRLVLPLGLSARCEFFWSSHWTSFSVIMCKSIAASGRNLFLTGLPQSRGSADKGRCILDERGVMNSWRMLFHGKEITSKSLAKAAALLDDMSGESPLHVRLA